MTPIRSGDAERAERAKRPILKNDKGVLFPDLSWDSVFRYRAGASYDVFNFVFA